MSISRQYKLDIELNKQLRTTKMSDARTVREFFCSLGLNIMTPKYLRSGSCKNFSIIYEVTLGTDLQGERIYGLCVKEWNGVEYIRSEASQLYNSINEINAAIKLL